jgi:plasmid maintenance system antidote protein VapI
MSEDLKTGQGVVLSRAEAVAIIVGIPTHDYTEEGAIPKTAEQFRDAAIKTLDSVGHFPPDPPMPAHVIDFIDEELKARGWTRRDLADRMGGDADRDELALQFLDIRDPGVLLGEESAAAIGRAFGTGADIWTNLDNTWRTATKARIQEHAAELYIALRMIFWSYEDDCGCECDGPTCCKKVKEQCAKCEARAAIALIEDPYAPECLSISTDQQHGQASLIE